MAEPRYKCPECKTMTMAKEVEDCMFCGGGEYYHCSKCGRYFDLKNKKEI